jgi:hypothetical protein
MINQYAETMRAFFRSVNRKIESDPTKLALAYANHFWEKSDQVHRHSHQKVLLPQDSLDNVSILARDTSLPFLTKRVTLIADTTVITHYGEGSHIFYEYKDTPPTGDDFLGLARSNDTTCYLRCPNLQELGEWLKKCKPLLLSGDVFYFPDIFVHRGTEGYGTDVMREWDTDESIEPLCDLIVESKKLVDTTQVNVIKSQFVRPILQLDLPFIENVDLGTFSKITSDQRGGIQRFRDFLRYKFLDLKRNEGSESYDANLAKIEIELRDGVRSLNSEYQAMKRKMAFQVTGAIIAAATATLVAVNSAAFGVLPQVLGTSGGLLAIANALDHYLSERDKLRDTPLYYLWLFANK